MQTISTTDFDSESSMNSYIAKIYNLEKHEKKITTKIHKKFEILFYEKDPDDLIMTSNLNDHFYYEEEFQENEKFFREEIKNLGERERKILGN